MLNLADLSRLKGFRFPRSVIGYAVWAYHRFALSLRDVEDLLAARGITISYETIRDWVARFGSQFAANIRRHRHRRQWRRVGYSGPVPTEQKRRETLFSQAISPLGRAAGFDHRQTSFIRCRKAREIPLMVCKQTTDGQRMGRFKSSGQAQRFLSVHDQTTALFRPKRHRLSATSYRHARADAFEIWTDYTGDLAAQSDIRDVNSFCAK